MLDWAAKCRAADDQLTREQTENGDLIRVDEVDVYRRLPQKLSSAYAWALQHTGASWFVKTDDDSVVRVGTLQHYLTSSYNARTPVVVGHISKGWGVHRGGKWAELTYAKPTYPNFPLGSHGHCVSRVVASYIAAHRATLFNYQGEDVSVGIWLDESPMRDQIQWVTSKHVANHGNCKDKTLWMIGHDIDASAMRACFEHADEISVAPAAVSVKPLGRLGNLMFEHASAYGISQTANFSFCMGGDHSGFSFTTLRAAFVGPFPPGCAGASSPLVSSEAGYALHDANIVNALRSSPVLSGYFQSWRYFDAVSLFVRSQFTFKPATMAQARSTIAAPPGRGHARIVGIHVRRGDYLRYKYLNFPPASYFEAAIAMFPNHRFVVLSEDVEWCKQQPHFVNNPTVAILPVGRSGPVDMAILSLCDGIILTLGSFGWWGAWLAAGARVVYYSNVFNLDHPTNTGKVSYEDHFMPGWTAVA